MANNNDSNSWDDDLPEDFDLDAIDEVIPPKKQNKKPVPVGKKTDSSNAPRRSSSKKNSARSASGNDSSDSDDDDAYVTFMAEQERMSKSDMPQFYGKSPLKKAKQKWIGRAYIAAPAITLAAALFFTAGWLSNRHLDDKLDDQLASSYNPSLRQRNADVGKSTIYAYYNGDPTPPVSVAKGIEWPGGMSSAEDSYSSGATSGGGEDSYDGVDSIGSDASITAVVKNLSLINSQVWSRKGSEAEVKANPAMETAQVESLTYNGIFNGSSVNITVMLMTPSPKPTQAMNPSDSLQPPILVSLPTITTGKPAVSGAPGSSDPGTRGGSFEEVTVDIPQIKKSIASWANAFAADDRSGLRDIVRDPQDGNYVGMLGGWTLKKDSTQTQWQYRRKSDGYLVVGVSFTATQAQNIKDEEGEAAIATTDNPQMMELLIDYSNKGNPAVVAWGVSGSAPTLRPYQNALKDNEVPDASGALQNGTSSGSGGAIEVPGNETESSSASESAVEIEGNEDESSSTSEPTDSGDDLDDDLGDDFL